MNYISAKLWFALSIFLSLFFLFSALQANSHDVQREEKRRNDERIADKKRDEERQKQKLWEKQRERPRTIT